MGLMLMFLGSSVYSCLSIYFLSVFFKSFFISNRIASRKKNTVVGPLLNIDSNSRCVCKFGFLLFYCFIAVQFFFSFFLPLFFCQFSFSIFIGNPYANPEHKWFYSVFFFFLLLYFCVI